MTTKNFGEIKAVAFDIDGTLYKDWELLKRMAFHFLRHNLLIPIYGLARVELRKGDVVEDFRKAQAEIMSKYLRSSPEKIDAKLDFVIYNGLKKYFAKIKPCDFVVDTIKEFKNAGFKIALLSDFPPEQKGELWGLKTYCDVLLGTEECGALKPSSVPFQVLSEKLGVKPEEVLYVGNNFKYDVLGPKKIGMKAAWFVSRQKYFWHKKDKEPDLVFWNYKELMNAVLN